MTLIAISASRMIKFAEVVLKVVIAEHPIIYMDSDLLFFLLCDTCAVVASSKAFVW